MRKLIAAFILSVFCMPGAVAQTSSSAAHPTAAPATVVSPEVLPDHRVIFRLRAPKASEVTITGDFWVEQGRVEKLTKAADGIWSLTTEPLTPDEYSYVFSVDGVGMPDPSNNRVKLSVHVQQSTFTVPGPEESILEPGSVPHGEIRIVYYPSAIIGNVRRMYMYFPPGYEQGKAKYPVAYLIHGGGDEDWAWSTIGHINFILDHLIAQGKAKPMIVAMPNMYAFAPLLDDEARERNLSLMQKSIVQELIPYVEQHYSVLPGPANRALGGLGIMRSMMPNLLWPSLGEFNYIGFASGGTDPDQFEALQKKYPGVLDDPANAKRVKFFLGDGVNDSSINSSRGFASELKKRGYTVSTYESTGTHGWPAFRRSMIEWVQQMFR